MVSKKKKEAVVEEEDVVVEVPATVPCPQHGARFQLEVQKDGASAYAVCNCQVRNNMWKGQVVWEMTPPRRKKLEIEESDNG